MHTTQQTYQQHWTKVIPNSVNELE